ncbi:MAG: class I SAM-dependent methyltransferase [Vicinamibacteria bacterium]|nr:class I SAM-dependent methyltransferase [Vicinamibacteria bacterium]
MNPTEYQRMFELEDTHWWYAGMRAISFALLDGILPKKEGLRILDAGCGTGNHLIHLSRRGRAVGVDISEDALRFCRVREVTVARASVVDLPFQDETFDVVTCFDVLYHRWVTQDSPAVRELARVLRPGGVLLARMAAYRWLWSAHDEAVHSRHRYVRREVIALLENAGLDVKRATYCNSILLPLIMLRRGFGRLTGKQGSDLAFLPRPIERILRGVLKIEARWLSKRSLPFGASITALCQKPPSRERPLASGGVRDKRIG